MIHWAPLIVLSFLLLEKSDKSGKQAPKGSKKAPHLWKTLNTEIHKRNFSLLSKSLVLFNRIFNGSFILQKDNKTEPLRNKENFRTTKPQEHVKLMIDSAQHKEKSFHKAASWKPMKEVHHGNQQTLEIQKNCQERHNAHPQEWFNFYKGWIKCTWAHWHTRPPPTSEVRSSKSWTPSLPASERGSFLTCATRPVSAPKISARLQNQHPNQELMYIPYQPLSFTYKTSCDYIQNFGTMKPR